jgi:membrane-bound serine protease (ClpP class)
MAAEALTPTFGVFGIAGVLAFLAGSIFLFKDAPPGFALSPWVIAVVTALSAGVFAWAAVAGLRQLRRPVRSGEGEYEHAIGEVLRWSDGTGHVRYHGEIWRAQGPAGLVEGQRVRIARREGLTLILEPHPGNSMKGEPHAL